MEGVDKDVVDGDLVVDDQEVIEGDGPVKAYVIEESGEDLLIKNLQGAEIFSLPKGFSEDQVDVVYNLVDNIFSLGLNTGNASAQTKFREALGINSTLIKKLLVAEDPK